MAATRTIGQMQEFIPANETVTAYLERFQLFVEANAIEDDKRVPTLLTVIGSVHCTLLRGLVSPQLPKEKTYDELVEILKKHFDPEPIIIAERFHFYRRNQGQSESISDYLANLRRLASRCKFGTFLQEALRDRLVCGMQSEGTQIVLLTKANLTLEKALEISQGMEAATIKSKELKGSPSSSSVLAVGGAPAGQTSPVVDADEETTIRVRVNSAMLRATSVVELATSHLLVALKQLGSPLEAPQGKPNGCPLLLSLPLYQKYPQHSLMTLQNQLMRQWKSLYLLSGILPLPHLTVWSCM